MNLLKSILIISSILLLSCAAGSTSQERYFDYSGNDGCSPANIGHRLGGDLIEFTDNSLEGMRGIASKQNSKCFKNWEFDLSEWNGEIFLNHDPILSNDKAKSLVSMTNFQNEFKSINVSKPIIIDLKDLSSTNGIKTIVSFANSLRSEHGNNIWFIVSPNNTKVLNIICPIVSGQFDVMLYRRGGKYCD